MAWRYTLEELTASVGGHAIEGGTPVSGASTDTRKLQPGQLFVALKGERFDANTMLDAAVSAGAAAVITSNPNPPGPAIVTEDPQAWLQRFAAWHRSQFDIPVFAITGSAGKTTTKEMVAGLLGSRFKVAKTPGNLNNDIGCPLSLLAIDADTGFAVIEMGANHPGEIASLCRLARPGESVITMIGEAHVEGFGGSVEAVAAAKSEIASGLGRNGVFHVNTDDPWCRRVGEQYSGEKVYFGSEGSVRLEGCAPDGEGGMLLDITPVGRLRLPLRVPAHANSVVIAISVALRHGVTDFEEPLRAACQGAPRFKSLMVGLLEVLDDSYNANPPSMRAALAALALHQGGRRFAALGDMFELGPVAERAHRELGEEAARQGVDVLFALGEYAGLVTDAARAAGIAEAHALGSHEAIADAVMAIMRPGDALLVKGSRGMRMENVIKALEERINPAAPAAS
ncbi:MAG: hypothetical protein RLZZ303_1565 [Candidatus Hydrogenedentota bacterium]